MTMKLKPARDLFAIAMMVMLGFTWWFFAPTALGGKTSYAVIYGVSMEPKFHRGDLVLIRKQSSYHVGEIVAYHSHSLRRPVLHRIVAMDGARYVFKGDNNNFRDPEHPTADQLFGREWILAPGAGSMLEKARSPRNAALIGAATAFMLLLGGGTTAKRRRRRRRVPVPAAPVRPAAAGGPQPGAVAAAMPHLRQTMPSPLHNHAWVGYFGLGAVALGLAALAGSVVVAGVAYTKPLARVVTQSNLYTLKGHFDWSATAPLGPVYDHTQLRGGDPLFLKLVHDVVFTFQSSVISQETSQLSCHGSFDAYLSDGAGWRRHLSLQPDEQCNSANATLTGHLNLDNLVGLTRRFEQTTGSHALQYHLQLVPHLLVQGSVGSQPVNEDFKPTLDFDLTSDRLRLPVDTAGGTNLDRARTGNGKTKTEQSMGPMKVSEVRKTALIGIPISLVLALLGGLLYLVVRGNDEVSTIRRRYGPWMIDVAAADRPPHLERRVESIDALSRIAERYERLIMHEQRGTLHSFLIEDDGAVYRYDAYEKTPWRGDHTQRIPAGSPGQDWHEVGTQDERR